MATENLDLLPSHYNPLSERYKPQTTKLLSYKQLSIIIKTFFVTTLIYISRQFRLSRTLSSGFMISYLREKVEGQ